MKWLYPPGSVCSTPGCGRPPEVLGRCRKCHAAWKWTTPRVGQLAFKREWMRSRPVQTRDEKRAFNTAYVRARRVRLRAERAAQTHVALSVESATQSAT